MSKNTVKDENDTQKALLRFPDPREEIEGWKKRYEIQTNLIIGIFVVALVTLLIIVGTLLVDSFHFNSAVYRQYTQSNQQLDQMSTTIENDQKLIQLLENKGN